VSLCWHRNGLDRTNSVLAYGLMSELILARDGQHDGPGFYPGLDIRGCKQEPGGSVSDTDIPVTYLLT